MNKKNIFTIFVFCGALICSIIILTKNISSYALDKTLDISINNIEIHLSKPGKLNSQNISQLNSDSLNTLSINDISEISGLKINDIDIDLSENEVSFKVDKISKNNKIKISVLYKDLNSYVNYYINTLTTNFPGYNVTANSPYEGDYYLTTHNEEYNFVFKLDNSGNIIFYKQVESNPFDFKKIITDDEKIRYGYLVVDSTSNRISGVGYSPTKLVILDENYNEINNIKLSEYEDIKEGTELENHDFIYLNDNHYILSSYQVVKATNIPNKLSNGNSPNVVAQVLQEVKNGEVIWQWTSTDYEELYELSVEYNNFNEDSEVPLDYLHFNSITIDPSDNNFICSFRNADSIIKLDRQSGDIIWILGGNGDEFNLSNEEKFSRQHCAKFTEDGYLTIYDNGVENEDSRAIKLLLDEDNKSVLEFYSYDVENFYKYTGSVQEIDSSNDVLLIGVGTEVGVDQDLVAIEKNYSTNEVYFEFSFDSGENLYRIYKLK